MATPVYGKQYIRFAETGLAPAAAPLSQFRVVKIDSTVPTEPPTIKHSDGGKAFGVLQQDIPAVDLERAVTLPRLGTVATSGLLLVEADDGNAQDAGTELKVDANGISSSNGNAVTVNGTSPVIRQQVMIGGIAMVLVSFN